MRCVLVQALCLNSGAAQIPPEVKEQQADMVIHNDSDHNIFGNNSCKSSGIIVKEKGLWKIELVQRQEAAMEFGAQ